MRREEGGAIVIEQLFVAPGHERRGNGHRLLAYAEGYAIAERARVLQIAVEEGNAQARSFYRRSGFAPVERELFERLLPSATNAVRGGGDMATGTVKWFSNDKRYGFITQDDGGKDVFVYHSAIRGRGHKSLAEGARVEYEVEQEPKGPQARDVHAAGSA